MWRFCDITGRNRPVVAVRGAVPAPQTEVERGGTLIRGRAHWGLAVRGDDSIQPTVLSYESTVSSSYENAGSAITAVAAAYYLRSLALACK